MANALCQAIYPVEATNYVLNPSAEADGNYYMFNGATISRSTTYAWRGRYSYRVQTGGANQGINVGLKALPNATTYVHFRVRGTYTAANLRVDLWLGGTKTPTAIETDGAWTWFAVDTGWTGASISGGDYCLIWHTTAGADFYVDAVQVEQTAVGRTTYLDGDAVGCAWEGIAHQSASTRRARLADGTPNVGQGRIVDLSGTSGQNATLIVSKALGMGLAPIEHNTKQAIDGGGTFESARVQPRTMLLVGVHYFADLATMHANRASLLTTIQPGEPFVLRWNGRADPTEIVCYYQKGAEGAFDFEKYTEDTPLTLVAYDPNFRGLSETVTTLTAGQAVTMSYALRRLGGAWADMNPSVLVYAIAISARNHVVVSGAFGGTGMNTVLRGWDGTSWATIGELAHGTQAFCDWLQFDPTGEVLYFGGLFGTLTPAGGGSLSPNNVAQYTLPATGVTGGTFAVLGAGTNGVNGRCRCGTVLTDGMLVVGGDFSQAGGSSAARLATWNGASWGTLGSNAVTASATSASNGYVHAMASGPDDVVYFGGDFDDAGKLSGAPSGLATAAVAGGTLAVGNYTAQLIARTGNGLSVPCTGVPVTLAGGNRTIRLTWTNPAGSTGTDIYRSLVANSGMYYLTTVAAGVTTYDDTGARAISQQTLPAGGTDGCRTPRVGKWTAATNAVESVGLTGMPGGIVRALALAANGDLYAGGNFGTADGATVNGVAVWNQQVWGALGAGVSGGDVYALAVDERRGEVLAGGTFAAAGGDTLAKNLAVWVGGLVGMGTWTHLDAVLPNATTVRAVTMQGADTLWVGFDTSGAGTLPSLTTVTGGGQGMFRSYPRLTVVGPGTLRALINYTLGQYVWLALTVQSGETVVIDLRSGYKTITSSIKAASRLRTLLAGDLGGWSLAPGANQVEAFFTSAAGGVASGSIRLADPNLRLTSDG